MALNNGDVSDTGESTAVYFFTMGRVFKMFWDVPRNQDGLVYPRCFGESKRPSHETDIPHRQITPKRYKNLARHVGTAISASLMLLSIPPIAQYDSSHGLSTKVAIHVKNLSFNRTMVFTLLLFLSLLGAYLRCFKQAIYSTSFRQMPWAQDPSPGIFAAACVTFGLASVVFYTHHESDRYQSVLIGLGISSAVSGMAIFGSFDEPTLRKIIPVVLLLTMITSALGHGLKRR